MGSITVIIFTKNEALNIERCINSVKGVAERIIVVDSGSTDETCAIAKELGVSGVAEKSFLERKLENEINALYDRLSIALKTENERLKEENRRLTEENLRLREK